MKLVCISDTHSMQRVIPYLPDGDVLIHAGDGLGASTLEDLADLNDWLGTRFINASSCDERYRPVNPPVVVEVSPGLASDIGLV